MLVDLESLPVKTVREILSEAEAHLHAVTHYGGLEEIKDTIDRDHIRDAHNLLKLVLGYTK